MGNFKQFYNKRIAKKKIIVGVCLLMFIIDKNDALSLLNKKDKVFEFVLGYNNNNKKKEKTSWE